MSEQPTEYGKELLEAVARSIAPLSWAALGLADTLAHKNRRTASLRQARAALLAACAKLKEPSEAMELAADMAVGRRVDWPEYDDVWRAMLSRLLTEIGT